MACRFAGTLAAAFLAIASFVHPQARAEDLHVMAAASLQPVLTAFLEAHGGEIDGDRLVPVFASSGTLARQISQGAPADLFLSANPRWADWLVEDLGLSPDRTADLLENRLVLVVPAADSSPRTLLDFAGAGRLMLGDPAHVPAGHYAKQALTALKLWDGLTLRLVFGSNVRTAVAFVERGEVDGAIVYRSDAVGSDRLRIAEEIDSGLHDPVVYRAVLLSDRARGLLAALQSADAAAMFRRYGFEPLPHGQ